MNLRGEGGHYLTQHRKGSIWVETEQLPVGYDLKGFKMKSLLPIHQKKASFCSQCSSAASPAAAKSLQSCLTLCDPIDGSPPGSPIPGVLQARTLEWVAISFSNAWKWKVKVKSLSRVRLLVTSWTAACQAPPSMGFSSKSTGVGCHRLLHNALLVPNKVKAKPVILQMLSGGMASINHYHLISEWSSAALA